MDFHKSIVDDVDINQKKETNFIEIVAWKKPLSSKVQIIISYGQSMNVFELGAQFVKDSKGKRIDFNSPIDALNFLTKNDWEYVDNYFLTEGNSNIVHFLLRRKNDDKTGEK